MERVFHRDDLETPGSILVMGIMAGQLDRRFVRLGPAVAKEHLVGKRMIDQHLRQLHLRLCVIEVRSMDQLRGLVLDRLNQVRVTMPEDVHRNPTDEIEILSPLKVIHLRPTPSHDREWLTHVRLHQITCSVLLQFFCRHDRRISL